SESDGAEAGPEDASAGNKGPGDIVRPLSAGASAAAPLFRRGDTVEQVAQHLGRARSTAEGYLIDFLRTERQQSIRPWVDEPTEQRVLEALEHVGDTGGRLRPIYEHLGEEVSYMAIRVVLAWHK